MASAPVIETVTTRVFEVPTERPESDGTLEWDSTTCVVAEVTAGGLTGLGYTYGHPAAAVVVQKELAEVVRGRDATAPQDSWEQMRRALRNAGLPGIAAHAVSAVDTALWDLKARLMNVSLARLWGPRRNQIEIYESGGFTSLSIGELEEQAAAWAQQGAGRVKIKVGRDPDADPARVAAARRGLGPFLELMVDANGAYSRGQAVDLAAAFEAQGVTWFEEPVSSDDLAGLRRVRENTAPGLRVAAGEYGYTPGYFSRMLDADSVDALQADASRCLGYTGFFKAAGLCEAADLPLSTHCCPALHAPIAACVTPLIHLENFQDHVRVEDKLFKGVPERVRDCLLLDLDRPGHGLEINEDSASRYLVEVSP